MLLACGAGDEPADAADMYLCLVGFDQPLSLQAVADANVPIRLVMQAVALADVRLWASLTRTTPPSALALPLSSVNTYGGWSDWPRAPNLSRPQVDPASPAAVAAAATARLNSGGEQREAPMSRERKESKTSGKASRASVVPVADPGTRLPLGDATVRWALVKDTRALTATTPEG